MVHRVKRRRQKCYKLNRTCWLQGQVEWADLNIAQQGTAWFVAAALSRDRMSIRIVHTIFVRNSLWKRPLERPKRWANRQMEKVLKWTCRHVHHHLTPKLVDGIAQNVLGAVQVRSQYHCAPVYHQYHCAPVYRQHHCVPIYRQHQCPSVYRQHHCVPVYRQYHCPPVCRKYHCVPVCRNHNYK